ncbi:MAG TPA: PA14 domain-containing protein [Pedobacter sp.]
MSMSKLSVLCFISTVIILVEACSQRQIVQEKPITENIVTQQLVPRPMEAWVIRSVLDLQPRMLSAALNKNLWVAYNTANGAFYKAWKGNINLEGAVYTSAHGPQPTTTGITYLEEPNTNPWAISENGVESIPLVTYKGHQVLNNQLILKYDLTHKEKIIHISEKPEYVEVGGDRVGLERVFLATNVPAGVRVSLKMKLNSLVAQSDYKTDGEFEIQNGKLTLNNGKRTTYLVNLTALPAPLVETKPEVKSNEEDVKAILAKSDCNACHNRDVKTVGPSYIAIAQRYLISEKNKNALITKVIKGGAGNWGQIPMTPHPNMLKKDVETLVSYILALDANQEASDASNRLMPKPKYNISWEAINPAKAVSTFEKPGMAVNIYQFPKSIGDFQEITGEMLPKFSGSVNALHINNNELSNFAENFVLHATGYINIKKTTNVVFRLVSDDGSRLFIDNKLVVDNGGNHALVPKDGEIILKPGKHPFKLEYYQGGYGYGVSLQWAPHGSEAFTVVPPSIFTFKSSDLKRSQEESVVVITKPGDGDEPLTVHPSFTLNQARPDNFQPKVGGIDFLSDGRMVVSTWDSLGAIYIVDGVKAATANEIKVKRIASGLAEPLGIKVVDDEIYVLQKQELTKLVDSNKDDLIDEYQTVANDWKVSANFHEFAFGLVYKDGYFYGALATAINPGGASTKPQIPDRGKIVKISKKDGSVELISRGLRTPNGIGFGVDNEIFIADNQGDWLPANKIVHYKEGAFYGSRSVDFEGTANLTETLPVVWLAEDEIGNSPSQPATLNVGPYLNQMIFGDVTHGGIKRVFAEKVNGSYQGVVFRFTQDLEAGVNRLAWGPDGSLYIGGIGSAGNWGQAGKLKYGLQKLTFNNKATFEMLAVRAKPNGVEIEFTEPLKEGMGRKASDYTIRQWYFKPTADYGGPKLDDKVLQIKDVKVSQDSKKVFLELPGMQPKHVLYIRLNKESVISSTGKNLWTTEAWYTMNAIPSKE